MARLSSISQNLQNIISNANRHFYHRYRPKLTRCINSSLVFVLFLNAPNILLVMVVAVVFSTPLITMHKWLLSMTTATPNGLKIASMAIATCLVNLSCSCNRLANISAILANLLNPRTFPFGI